MRFVILFASVVVQLCLGGLYAWSTFVPVLKSSYGLSTTQTQVIFGTLIAVFTITMVFAGRILESKGPRLLLICSGILFAVGYEIASFSEGNFLLLLLGISLVAGIATGIGYVCPLSTCIKWFPEHKGLVTGIAVAGFGGGAVVLTNFTEMFLERGVNILTIFRDVGLIYGITIAVAGMIIHFPNEEHTKPSNSTHFINKITKDPFFWALTSAMFCGTFAGLLVIGNLMPMALASGISPFLATMGISAFAVGNAIGRIAWGRVVDRIGTTSIRISLLFLSIALAVLLFETSNSAVFIMTSLLIGFGFGACFVIHAVLVASRYGANNVGSIYPLIFLAYGAAGITGPMIGGWLYDFTGRYSSSIGASIVVVVIGLLTSNFMISKNVNFKI